MRWLGEKQVPFVMVFTKTDKLSSSAVNKNILNYKKEMLKEWESLPDIFITSTEQKLGRNEILDYIDKLNGTVKK
jgi:GTP-binding protein